MLNALKVVFYNPPIDPCECEPQADFLDISYGQSDYNPRRTSAASSVSGYCSEGADRDRSMSGDSGGLRFRPIRRIYQQQSTVDQEPVGLSWIPETMTTEGPITIIHDTKIEEENAEGDSSESSRNVTIQEEGFLGVPGSNSSVSASGSSETLIPTSPMSPSNLSAVTLVGSTGSGGDKNDDNTIESSSSTSPAFHGKAPTTPLPERIIPKRPPRTIEQQMAAANAAALTTTAKQQQLPTTITTASKSLTTTAMTTSTTVDSKPPSSAKASSAPPPPVIVDVRKHSTASISTTIIVTTPSMTATSAKPSAISPPSQPFDRRPSVGYNAIPHAALCQHRYSLQLNDEVNASKVRWWELCHFCWE